MNSRLISLLAVTLALGACNARAPTATIGSARYASLDAALDNRPATTASLSGALAPERRASPVAVLPAWMGRPTRLRERDDADSFEQAVSLGRTPRGETRENLVLLTIPRSGAASDRLTDGAVSVMGKPTEAGIRAEMDAVLPGVAMKVVERPAANAYGPYGLAIGRGAGGSRCLYAWQWIEEPPTLQAGQGDRNPLSLRVRLCRSDITLEAMAAAVNQLRLVPRFSGEPVPQQTVALARPESEPHRRPRRVRIVARPAEAPRAVMPAYRTAAPVLPAPDPSGRRYLGAETAGPAPSVPAPAAIGANAVRGTLAGLGGSATPAGSGGISADLPPEAYRGPSGGAVR